MTCTVWGLSEKEEERNFGSFNNVLTVEGNIKVLASTRPDKMYIKTHPHIGVPAHIEIKHAGYPKDAVILVVAIERLIS